MLRGKTSRNVYLNDLFESDDELLKSLKQQALKEDVSHMQILPYEGRILQFFVRAFGLKKIVEIGTLYAYSTLYLARALGKEGRIWTCDKDKTRQAKARQILSDSKECDKIEWVSEEAEVGLKSIENHAPFDMVFIDADKSGYGKYLTWAEHNLRKGGLLLADNTFLFGGVYNEETRPLSEKTKKIMREFNKRLCSSSCWQGVLLPTEEGLTVAIKK